MAWANSKKRRTHEKNVDALEYEFNQMGIDINEIQDIPAVITLLRKLVRVRKREVFLKEAGILPQISDDEWSKFNSWLRIVGPMLVGYAVESPPKPPNEVATDIIELAMKYAMAFDFIDAHPIEARSRVLELYMAVLQEKHLAEEAEDGSSADDEPGAAEEKEAE